VGAPQLLLGHSMGGKVALQYAAAHAADAPASVWALDSVPGPVAGDPHAVGAVLDAVASLPAEIPSRAWLADNLRGRVPSATAAWLASALIPVPGAPPTGPLRTGFDLQGARQMYESYKETECACAAAFAHASVF
jgi:pimeloyl-ACP methyl ester carboxylesterase